MAEQNFVDAVIAVAFVQGRLYLSCSVVGVGYDAAEPKVRYLLSDIETSSRQVSLCCNRTAGPIGREVDLVRGTAFRMDLLLDPPRTVHGDVQMVKFLNPRYPKLGVGQESTSPLPPQEVEPL